MTSLSGELIVGIRRVLRGGYFYDRGLEICRRRINAVSLTRHPSIWAGIPADVTLARVSDAPHASERLGLATPCAVPVTLHSSGRLAHAGCALQLRRQGWATHRPPAEPSRRITEMAALLTACRTTAAGSAYACELSEHHYGVQRAGARQPKLPSH